MLDLFGKWVGWRYAKLISMLALSLILFIYLFVWNLGGATPGISSHEAESIKSSSSLRAITSNPINAPHKALQLLLQHFGHSDAFWMRLTSAAFVLLFLVCFYLLILKWFGRFVAALATILFVSTPWIVILARSASDDIMLLSPILIVAAYTWFKSAKEQKNLAWFSLMVAAAIALYAPGVVWLLLIGIVAGYKGFMGAVSKISKSVLASGIILFVLLLAPLIAGIYQNPSVGKTLLLIPNDWPSLAECAKALLWSISGLVYKLREHMDFGLGRLPVLNIAQSALALLGLYAMGKSARKEAYGLVGLLVIGLVASAVNENAALLILCLPSALVFCAAGLRYLSVKWSKVFPLNPLPRTFAYVLVSLLVLVNLAYSVRYCLAAWPHNSDTRKVYVIK